MLLSSTKKGASLGLLVLCARGSSATKNHHDHYQETHIDTTTVYSPTTVPVTHYVNVTVPHYVDVTVSNYVNTTLVNTVTKVVTTCITESTTTTLHFTTAVTETETDSTSITDTLYFTMSETDTDSTSITNTLYYTVSSTETDLATVTNTETETTTSTVPATITTYTTQTVFSTTYDPCPKSCSISAASVTLYFWPTNRPYTYPSTYVDENLGYTFVSPSVYMMIPSAVGINTAGHSAGPSTTSWILPLDLDEVSTIDGTATKQLTLSHLGTDCPKTAEASAIATMNDPACNPVLAAPRQVHTWAYPCNACGRFGLFDPPYAVPPVTGLIPTTAPPPAVSTVTATPTPAPAPPVGVVEVIYYVDGKPVSTATLPSTGITGTVTSSVFISAGDSPTPTPSVTSSADQISTPITSVPVGLPSSSEAVSPTSAVTASATKLASGTLLLAMAILALVMMV